MCSSRWILIAVIFLCLVCVAGSCKRKKKVIIIAPNWGLLDDPAAPASLDVTDPPGDHLGYGDTADLKEMQGTYDGYYVYFHVDVYSSPDIDETGDIWYFLEIDSNGNDILDAGDYTLIWNAELGAGAFDYEGNSVSIPGAARVNPEGGIDYAIGRSLVDQTSFKLFAGILFDEGGALLEPGDDMPDSPTWATFTF
jgi:hypothetical protein